MDSGSTWRWRAILPALGTLTVLGLATWILFWGIASLHLKIKVTPVGTNELIAIIAAVIALAAFALTAISSLGTRRDSLRVEKSNAYFNLEVASSEVFKYEAEKEPVIKDYRETYAPEDPESLRKLIACPNEKLAYNLYFQTLNLFEVCARFRRQEIIEHEVFASWVAWFYDTLDDWYFRRQWPDFRGNYTDDVRDIFDIGVRIFEKHGELKPASDAEEATRDARRKREFYAAVAAQMQCKAIHIWLDHIARTAETPPTTPGWLFRRFIKMGWRSPPQPSRSAPPRRRIEKRLMSTFRINWLEEDLAGTDARTLSRDIASFFARTIGDDPRYISHGEIQGGLSNDGTTWQSNLERLFVEDLSAMDPSQSLLVARAANSTIVGAAIVEWTETGRVRFATLADLSIEPDLRSSGLGSRMIDHITAEARSRKMDWIFLESGKENLRAHRFFERHGFDEISHVFARRL